MMRKNPDYLRGCADALIGVAVRLVEEGSSQLLKEVIARAQQCANAANEIQNEREAEQDHYNEALRRIVTDSLPQFSGFMSKLLDDMAPRRHSTDAGESAEAH